MSDSEIFEKPVAAAAEPAKKPRKLTEKQLENLAKGRAKMAEKRAAKGTETKAAKTVESVTKPVKVEVPKTMDKELAKIEKEGIKEQKSQRKTAKKTEKQQLKAIDKADDVIARNREANFKEIGISFMEKCESPEQLKLLKKMLARYSKDDIMDETKLKQKMTRDLSVIRDYVAKNK